MPKFKFPFLKRKKGTLTYQQRKQLPSNDFVFPKERKYPIYNESHARNALSRVSQYGSDYEKEKVCNAVEKKYPYIHAESCNLHNNDSLEFHQSYQQ